MADTPPWASGPSSNGFSAPAPRTPTPAEPRAGRSHRPAKPAGQRKSRLVTIALAMLVVVLVVAAGLLAWKALEPEDVSAPLPASEFNRPSDGTAVGPDGTKQVSLENGATGPGGATKMASADMAPSTLFIPAIGVYMPLEGDSTFVASHYAGFETIKVPADPHHGVWYAAGAPLVGGDAGTTLVASHVSNVTGWGALRYLYTLTGGEMIYTKDAAGALQKWQLTTMKVEGHLAFPQEYWSAKGERQLVVTTCGGTLNAGHYNDNIFAIATPVASNA